MSDITSLQQSFAPLLKPFAWANAKAMRLREWAYRRGVMKAWTPPAVTVAVGNIGWGGTGKTPIAGWLLNWAEAHNRKAMLLTRGYKAHPNSYPYHVVPGALAEEAGDEPLMLATEHPEAIVLVDPVRSRSGKLGVKQFDPQLIILDDGFQHMAVKRHCNLVLLKPEDLSHQWNALIPAGSWREPKEALHRADAFLIKIGPEGFDSILPHFNTLLGHLRRPIFSFQILPTGLRHVLTGQVKKNFDNKNYLLVTGVGAPDQVERTAKQYLGYKPAKHIVFRDHHTYTKNDVFRIESEARARGCEAILCTPKDAVKLGPMCSDSFWKFDLRVQFGPSSIGKENRFDTWWDRRYERLLTQKASHGGHLTPGD